MKKSTFLPKFIFFSFSQIWHFCTKIDIDRNTSDFPSKFARHYSINVLSNSHICPKTDAFCMKCYFLLKENNATKTWHFSKTEDTALNKKFNISIFENGDHLLQEWKKILQNWRLCMNFLFTCETHITKKLTLLKQVVTFFQNRHLKYF